MINPPGQLEVVILASEDQLREFVDEQVLGMVSRRGDDFTMLIAGESHALNATPSQRMISHELAHYLSAYALQRQPRWLAEGLAG